MMYACCGDLLEIAGDLILSDQPRRLTGGPELESGVTTRTETAL